MKRIHIIRLPNLPWTKAKRQARIEEAIRDGVYSAIQAMNCTEPRPPEQMQPKLYASTKK